MGVQIPLWKGAVFRGKRRIIVKFRDILRSSVLKALSRPRCRLGCGLGWVQGIMCSMESRGAKGVAWQLFLAFVGLVARQVAPMCHRGRAHWRHLPNTIETSVCGGDAAFCQITLTTCLSYFHTWCGLRANLECRSEILHAAR